MPRTQIEPHKGHKRWTVRRKRGKFTKSQDVVGRSLAADRRECAKRTVKSGEGDRGDRASVSRSRPRPPNETLDAQRTDMPKEPKKLDELFHEALKDIYFAEKKVHVC